MYKSGEITKADAISMLRKIMAMQQSGGVANLKHLAKRQYGKGNVMSVRTPRDINNANGLQVGGFLPAALGAAGIGLLASLVSPFVERISSKYLVGSIPALNK